MEVQMNTNKTLTEKDLDLIFESTQTTVNGYSMEDLNEMYKVYVSYTKCLEIEMGGE